MSIRKAAPSVVVFLLAASAALASVNPGPSNPPPPPPDRPEIPGMSGQGNLTPRQEAEQSYALAYEEVGKAKKDLEEGKGKKAEKKFRRALERCERAVQLDATYHEAWNLVGYTARKVGDYDKAFKAYERCLMIKPDYAPAREYLGEAWLEKGDAKQARAQLVWLERLGAAEEAKTLRAAVDAWSAAHPDSAGARSPAPADSAASSAGSGTGR